MCTFLGCAVCMSRAAVFANFQGLEGSFCMVLADFCQQILRKGAALMHGGLAVLSYGHCLTKLAPAGANARCSG